jgi:murein DD-endopeptidase MepM/ murein hydrolase activator NlpD
VHLSCAALIVAAAACASSAPAALPAPRPAPDPIEQPAEFRLPVDGVWIVSQGYHGADSHHGRAAYALDLVKLNDAGQAYAGKGRRLDDWYGFGAEVLASADGVVVRARDHFQDNRVMGKGKDTNTVIVQHGDVFSEYVHLQRSSLRVREGERVVRGQVLARVGNSGAQTPHLHWALLSSLEPIRTRPATIACEVLDATGAWRSIRGAPISGATIRPRLPEQ